MEWYTILAVSFLLLFVLMGTGLPVFVAFLIANVAGVLVTLGERGFGMFSNSMYETLTSESFVTIPLFVLMGEILFRSGSVDVLSIALDKWIGKVNGRMYYLVIGLSTIFGALSGAAAAVAAMLGRSVLPKMQKLGYDTNLTNFTILGGASLAPIIPLTGFSVTGSLGTVSHEMAYDLTGISITGSLGTISHEMAYDLTGISSTASLGTISHEMAYDLTGISSTASLGSFSFLAYTDIGISGNTAYSDVDVTGNTSYTDINHVA